MLLAPPLTRFSLFIRLKAVCRERVALLSGHGRMSVSAAGAVRYSAEAVQGSREGVGNVVMAC